MTRDADYQHARDAVLAVIDEHGGSVSLGDLIEEITERDRQYLLKLKHEGIVEMNVKAVEPGVNFVEVTRG